MSSTTDPLPRARPFQTPGDVEGDAPPTGGGADPVSAGTGMPVPGGGGQDAPPQPGTGGARPGR